MNTEFLFPRTAIGFIFMICMNQSNAQPVLRDSLDPLSFGVVLDDPAMSKVTVQYNIPYMKNGDSSLSIDLYLPPGIKKDESRPAIIFLNAIGERAGEPRVKSWGIYSSWPKLMAAKGYIGISMETDGARVQESLKGLFDFFDKQGSRYHINSAKLGVYAASANVGQAFRYLMGADAYPGIKAAVLYYGFSPEGPFRKDLPVFFMISEGDVARTGYKSLWDQVLKNNAPWTIRMGTGMPHAFDAYADNDQARKIVNETISFWKNELDPVPQPSFAKSTLREVFELQRLNPERSVMLMKSIADKNPDNLRVQSLYADVLNNSGKQALAEPVYQNMLRIDGNNIRALVGLTVAAYRQNNAAEAESYFSRALATGKITAGDYSQLGMTLLIAGKDREAVVYYRKALDLRQNGFDYYNLACAYAKYGDKENALQALEQSFSFGYPSRQQVDSDPDLNSIRNEEKYKTLVAKLPP